MTDNEKYPSAKIPQHIDISSFMWQKVYRMKRCICLIIIISFIYTNCVYAIGVNTLAGTSPFSQPEYVTAIRNLGCVFDVTAEAEVDVSKIIYDCRNLFSQILGDEPDGISVILNREPGEIFVFSVSRIIHLYKDAHTQIPVSPLQTFEISKVKIDIYPFTPNLIDSLKGILVEGVPSPHYSRGEVRRIIARLPNGPLKDYLSGLAGITSADYAKVPDNVAGCLWKDGVPGLEDGKEAKNAIKIREYIISNGRQLDIGPDYPWIKFLVWDGANGEDRELNDIIQRNLETLFSRIPAEEREALLQSLKKYLHGKEITIALPDRSRHWFENSRGDRFIGINRIFLSRIKETLISLSDEINGENRHDEIVRIENSLRALETYLQTYIYHELRHEAFIEERGLLGERGYKVDDMDFSDMRILIERLPETERKEFDSELERRQNGLDARYFVGVFGLKYEEFLRCLLELEILDMGSLFLHAAAICGFSLEVPVGDGGYKHYNELITDDFIGIPRDKLVRKVYKKYEAEYTEMYREDKEGTESRYRGKISYLLYKIGLNDYIRVDDWRSKSTYDYNLAKEYIIRLIDFTSRYERYLRFVPGRGEISMFRKRERPLSYRDAAQHLLVSLLSSGDYSQAVLRELGFKTSGIVNTVTGNKFEFWKLIEEVSKEQVDKGDLRFKGITAEAMRSASIEKEMLPRLKIVILFWDYLKILPGSRFSRPYREIFGSLYLKYRQYSEGRKIDFDNTDLDNFDKLYKKVCKILASEFSVTVEEDENLLLALWDTFELVENFTSDLDYRFSEPLFANGTEGDEKRFKRDEITEIMELKKVFDNVARIRLNDIKAESTKRRVQLVWSIYKKKVLKYREGLCNILNRYGTDKDINGNRVRDLLRQTRGWSSAVWLAREYSKLFGGGIIEKSLDLDSGLSVFYYALSRLYGINPGSLSGLRDVISDPASEYFGVNPNRLAGDFTDGGLVDIKTGNTIELEPESQHLILSIYRLHTVTSPQKMFNIFSNVHRLLRYGGHFAITLPYGRVFCEEALKVLRDKMGFEPVVSPGITWNELSEGSRKRIISEFGEEEAKRIERGLFKRRFYVIILKKTGVVKEGDEGLKDKTILLPEVLTDKEIGKPIMPEVVITEEDIEETPREIREVSIDETGWTSAGVLDGITFHSGDVADQLAKGLGESQDIREKAENIGVISDYQEMIREILEEVVVPSGEKLEGFIGQELMGRIEKALAYKDSDYTTSIEEELLGLTDELETLKKFIIENHKEFMEKIEEIKKKAGLYSSLTTDEQGKYNRITGLKITDLNKDTLRDVRDIYNRLIEIEGLLKEKAGRDKFTEENWPEYQELQRLLRRYRAFGEGREIRNALRVDKKDLTKDIMKKTIDIDERMARRFSTSKRRFNSLKELESAIKELFKWIDCEFFFSFIDMKFLSSLKDKWEEDELAGEWLDYIGRLHVFMDVMEEWKLLKNYLDWDKGLAVLLKDKPENEYMRLLDEELLYKPFLDEREIKGRVLALSPIITGEKIRDNLINVQDGEDLVISINDTLGLTEGFLEGLERLGFEIRNLYEAWLETDGLEGFMRRGKWIILVRKTGNPSDIDTRCLSLQMEKEEAQDYSNFIRIREKLLQELGPSDFHINTRELLSKKRIIDMYPDWAEIYLGKGEWVGIFFDKEKVEKAVGDYRMRHEEEERKRKERKARLIKRLDIPFVKITYEGIWTEFLVRDLAQILLRLISDFDNPNPLDIAGHPFITGHPRLGTIPKDEVISKIEELIRYRQYDLKIERLYREFSRLTGVFFHMGICKLNVTADIDGIKRTIPLIDKDDSSKILRWHEYTNGADPSPFGRSPEEWYNIITGNLLVLRRLEPSRLLEAPVEGRRLVIHCLSDQKGFFKKFAGGFRGVEIATGGESFKPFFELLSGVYQNKNFDEKYIEEIADLAYLQLVYFLSRVQSGSLESTEVREITRFFTQNTERLLSGEMTIDEYNDFVSRLRQRLNVPGLPGQEIEAANQAQKSFYYYIHGEGQEKEIRGTKDDIILSKYADGLAKAKYYFDAMYLLRSVRLYILSEEEKKVLDELISDMPSGDASSRNRIISYLKADNTINRYLYFSFIYLSRIWAQEPLDQVADWHNNITEEILKIEPRLTAYTIDASNMNIISLLTELYRLKQMLEDVSLGSAGIEVQLSVNRLITIIWDKTTDRQLLRELNRMTEKILDSKTLMECDLAFIGNPYHTDLTKKAIIGLGYLKNIDRFAILTGLEEDLTEDSKKNMEAVIEELKILFIYHPDETQTALENTAWAIARSADNPSVRFFMGLFRRHNPDKFGKLEELVGQYRKKVSRDVSYKEMVRLMAIAMNNPDPDSKELKDAIKKSQWLRCKLLGMLNRIGLPGGYESQCNRLVELVFQSVENPYEMYNFAKSLIRKKHAGIQHIYGHILIKWVDKMAEFLKDGKWRDAIIDILTRTYNQFLLMKEFIPIGLDTSNAFRKFIAELFCGENGIVSGYAYAYIVSYLEDVKNRKIELIPGTDRVENIHEVFLYIIEGLLEKHDNIDGVRFRRLLELFAYSALNIPDVKLDKEWGYIMDRYRKGHINRNTLSAIWRNANQMIEAECAELGDKTEVLDVKSRFGLFDKDGGDTYFCEMTDSEIDPQIKWLLEKHPERFRFIEGVSSEGVTGTLEVSDERTEMILSARDSLVGEYPELRKYNLVVLQGVGTSGHNSLERGGRIYIPYEILVFADTSILVDFIEHEYLHTKDWTEEDIIRRSKEKRPGVYEKARELYREYIAKRLVNTAKDVKGAEILKDKLERILRRVQGGKRIEFSETQLHRLLWLIDRSKEIQIAPEITQLINLILEPNYAGDPGQVIMAVEKAILSHLYTEEQLERQGILERINEIKTEEQRNLISIHKTHAGLRFEGKELPSEAKNTINYVYGYKTPEPAREVKGTHYVLIDEYRAERLGKVIEKVSKKWGVVFVTPAELPEGVKPDVVLIDPEDADREKWSDRGFELYLPLVYTEKTFELAAWLSINKPERLRETPVFEFVMNFYKELGIEVTEDEVIKWFSYPWRLKDKIVSLTEQLKILRIAFEKIDTSA